MIIPDNKAAVASAERSGESATESPMLVNSICTKRPLTTCFASERIDVFECIYSPRGNLIEIERLRPDNSWPDSQTTRFTQKISLYIHTYININIHMG